MLIEEHAGWQVCGEAHSGREAVEKCTQLHPDVIVIDVSMPDLNGLGTAARNKANTKSPLQTEKSAMVGWGNTGSSDNENSRRKRGPEIESKVRDERNWPEDRCQTIAIQRAA